MAVLRTFWQTMKTLLNTILLRKRKSPFTTSIGLKRDTITAGRSPEIREMTQRSKMVHNTAGKSGRRTISVVSSLAIQGRKQMAITQPRTKQPAVNRNDSPM